MMAKHGRFLGAARPAEAGRSGPDGRTADSSRTVYWHTGRETIAVGAGLSCIATPPPSNPLTFLGVANRLRRAALSRLERECSLPDRRELS